MTIRLSDALRTAVVQTNSLTNRLDTGFLYLYSGTQPASAEDVANGTLLAVISINGAGSVGLTWDAGDNAGEIKKAVAETWQGTGLAANTARWFRFNRLSTDETGTRAQAAAAAGGTVERLDGSVGTSGSDFVAANVTIAIGAPLTVDTFVLRLPASIS